ncbi:hypothetical protein NDU88_005293 [Pleurodeles waltl]|uniref:Uncharacterized protein n=1 Tax=Pleurodeles waltl TaxID=8319 RepID=A0AAV7TW71_PLEWA|nr:hypothetical protein NDU88_005293 [Pleurodeles waltl]
MLCHVNNELPPLKYAETGECCSYTHRSLGAAPARLRLCGLVSDGDGECEAEEEAAKAGSSKVLQAQLSAGGGTRSSLLPDRTGPL